MTEEEKSVYLWFTQNLPLLIAFYSALHIYNLVNMENMASKGEKHMLIPENWPIGSGWSLELLSASIQGVLKNECKRNEWLNWIKTD